MSFFSERMALLGVTEENNKINVFDPEAEQPGTGSYPEYPIFKEDKKGNIEITYYTITGELIVYYSEAKHTNHKRLFYKTKRLKDPQGDRKYHMPKGQGTFPWFSPLIMEAFQEGEKIETLYLTEGVFKAWTAGLHGLHVVGLSSITHYMEKETGMLHWGIRRLIERCQVEHVVILWDADCLDISMGDLSLRTDLKRRPWGFFRAAQAIRKLVREMPFEKTREAPRVHFMHPKKHSLEDNPKGLDDVIIQAEKEDKLSAVIGDIKRITEKGPYFYRQEITTTAARLLQYFRLDKDKPEDFYFMHAEEIGENEFFFFDNLYHFSEASAKLKLIAPGWAKHIRWIGDDYYEEREVPSAYGNRKQLLARKKETLTYLYGKEFQQFISYFVGFCNIPDHFNYQPVVELGGHEFYNRYFPFQHQPAKGKFEKTLEFIKHIFGHQLVIHPETGKQLPMWELGLDYVQLLLTKPTQILPVLCLFSPENNTGKSTFGKLLAEIFRNNVIFVSNSDLQSDFNEPFADKLAVVCDETLLERKRDTEKIKAWSTASQITVNPKGQRQFTIDFFTKFIFNSNNWRMIYLSKDDERFWIIRVPKATKDNPNLLQEMVEEIPAFIHFLKEREMVTEKESRMWFKPEMIRTDVFQDVVNINEPGQVADVRESIEEMFLNAGKECQTIRMPLKNIKDEFFPSGTSTKYAKELLRDYLFCDLQVDDEGKSVHTRGTYMKTEMVRTEDGLEPRDITVKWKGRPYVFKREQFVNDSNISDD